MTLPTAEQRLQLVNAAPAAHGDHVVSIEPALHAVVRVDGLGRRIVALGSSAAEASARAKPKVAAPTIESDARSSASRGSQRSQGAPRYTRKVDAGVFENELSEYRRAVAAIGIETSELL
jgi:hypothetical protein